MKMKMNEIKLAINNKSIFLTKNGEPCTIVQRLAHDSDVVKIKYVEYEDSRKGNAICHAHNLTPANVPNSDIPQKAERKSYTNMSTTEIMEHLFNATIKRAEDDFGNLKTKSYYTSKSAYRMGGTSGTGKSRRIKRKSS